MWDFLLTVQKSHLVDGGQVRRHPTMNTQDASINHGPERQKIECLIEVFPAVGVAIFSVDLVEEAVHHGDIAALVVAPQQVDPVRVFHLQAEQ